MQSRNTVFNLTISVFIGSITHLGGTRENSKIIIKLKFLDKKDENKHCMPSEFTVCTPSSTFGHITVL